MSDTIFKEVIQGTTKFKPDVALSPPERKTVGLDFRGLRNFFDQKRAEREEWKRKHEQSEKQIGIVASRGPLAELSGFYCDACWTRQNDILKQNPTMVGYTFVENFADKAASRIIGGCLTLERKIKMVDSTSGAESSAKALVIRGLNPQNNALKRYDAESLVENFFDYIRTIARRGNHEYVVIPLSCLGALSNRPEINQYLQKKYKEAQTVQLEDDVTFNGYTIKDSCVVVRVAAGSTYTHKSPKPANVPQKDQSWMESY